ncbi:MAG: xanthine dehydrogenase family protein molybdopterin-binding subunit [Gammaproteobacteria bacterium]|nr:xanthine dehydrogenase family protein molybdopterin-binding subunit [Gammaproteobacteria bacterium]
MSHYHIQKYDRRRFLQLSGLAGGGLLLGVSVVDTETAHAAASTFAPSAFLQISRDGILIYATQPEIGQGVRTSIPMILAEELDAAWKDVEVKVAGIDAKRYGVQTAGGSTATPRSWNPMRRAGAVARAMLIEAAARNWNVASTDCSTRDSEVIHVASGRRVHYRDLAETAATLPVPDAETLRLKSRAEYRLLNTRVRATDGRDLVTGRPTYASDVRIPGMLYAMYVKCPRIGGKVRSANLDDVRRLPGVVDAFALEGNGDLTELKPGIALIARDTWSALGARRALRIEWDESSAASDDWPRSPNAVTSQPLSPRQRKRCERATATRSYRMRSSSRKTAWRAPSRAAAWSCGHRARRRNAPRPPWPNFWALPRVTSPFIRNVSGAASVDASTTTSPAKPRRSRHALRRRSNCSGSAKTI